MCYGDRGRGLNAIVVERAEGAAECMLAAAGSFRPHPTPPHRAPRSVLPRSSRVWIRPVPSFLGRSACSPQHVRRPYFPRRTRTTGVP
jgi:hypothetical protein